ncbi:MAG: hypothetical protein K2G13_04420, partial [Muribaculaceae bacterium]|nr:hypothetical protein [Muribaculaceae bacterium]
MKFNNISTVVMTVIIAILGIASCNSNEPDVINRIEGTGILTIEGEITNLKYGDMITHVKYDYKNFIFTFRSYDPSNIQQSNSSQNNSFDLLLISFKVTPEKTLKIGEEWTILSDTYNLRLEHYHNSDLSANNVDIWEWDPVLHADSN